MDIMKANADRLVEYLENLITPIAMEEKGASQKP